MGCALGMVHHIGKCRKPPDQHITKLCDPRISFLKILHRLFDGQAEAGYGRHIFRSGTHTLLLAASVNDGPDQRALFDIQKSHTLRPMELMCTDREQIHTQL